MHLLSANSLHPVCEPELAHRRHILAILLDPLIFDHVLFVVDVVADVAHHEEEEEGEVVGSVVGTLTVSKHESL